MKHLTAFRSSRQINNYEYNILSFPRVSLGVRLLLLLIFIGIRSHEIALIFRFIGHPTDVRRTSEVQRVSYKSASVSHYLLSFSPYLLIIELAHQFHSLTISSSSLLLVISLFPWFLVTFSKQFLPSFCSRSCYFSLNHPVSAITISFFSTMNKSTATLLSLPFVYWDSNSDEIVEASMRCRQRRELERLQKERAAVNIPDDVIVKEADEVYTPPSTPMVSQRKTLRKRYGHFTFKN